MKALNNGISRKQFLRLSMATTAIVTLPVLNGCANDGRALRFTSLDEVLAELDRIENGSNIRLQQKWSLYKILCHLAQTIQGSMHGFSKVDPPAIQSVGKLAFGFFKAQGYMFHSLSQEVPLFNGQIGPIPDDGEISEAIQVLRTAIQDFKAFNGALFPHFTYGSLSYEEWELANAFHCADHFSSLTYT